MIRNSPIDKGTPRTRYFYDWLIEQQQRPDRVGDLARDVGIDDGRVPRRGGYHAWSTYLSDASASDGAVRSFHLAWDEFEKTVGREM